MKNKGRKHIVGIHSETTRGSSMNLKGTLTHITRPIKSMSSKGEAEGRFDKKKWMKRVRGYFKSQTKKLL